ncbi:putative adhesin [Streptomyces sp. NPDC048419]|uniref:putative adhesin n=1 Tax=Streptomyces sp. NPDC048419 TaxID=3365547 RepID=UPI003710F925
MATPEDHDDTDIPTTPKIDQADTAKFDSRSDSPTLEEKKSGDSFHLTESGARVGSPPATRSPYPKSIPSGTIKLLVERDFRAELEKVVVDRERLAILRSEWAAVISKHGRETVVPPPEPLYVEHLQRSVEEKKIKAELEKARSGVIRSESEDSAKDFRERATAYTCLLCGKDLSAASTVSIMRHDSDSDGDGTTLHLLHGGGCTESVRKREAATSCATCNEMVLNSEQEIAVRSFAIPIMAIMGHGDDSGEKTFVPLGMTLHSYAEPGQVLSSLDAVVACTNPRLYPPKASFPQGAVIPNMTFTPDNTYEQEVEVQGWASAMGVTIEKASSMEGVSGDVWWVGEPTQLCDGNCELPFHSCAGILGLHSGVKDLYLGTCFGSGGQGRKYTDTEAGYVRMAELLKEAGESDDPSRALTLFADMPKWRQNILLTVPFFKEWYDKALPKTEQKIQTRETDPTALQAQQTSGTPPQQKEGTQRQTPEGTAEEKTPSSQEVDRQTFEGLTFGRGYRWKFTQLDDIHKREQSTTFNNARIEYTGEGGQTILFNGSAEILHSDGTPTAARMILHNVAAGAESTAAWAGQIPYQDERGGGYTITPSDAAHAGAWFTPFGSTYVFIGRHGQVRFVAPTTLITAHEGATTRPITEILGTALPRSMPLTALGIDVVHTPEEGTEIFRIS